MDANPFSLRSKIVKKVDESLCEVVSSSICLTASISIPFHASPERWAGEHVVRGELDGLIANGIGNSSQVSCLSLCLSTYQALNRLPETGLPDEKDRIDIVVAEKRQGGERLL